MIYLPLSRSFPSTFPSLSLFLSLSVSLSLSLFISLFISLSISLSISLPLLSLCLSLFLTVSQVLYLLRMSFWGGGGVQGSRYCVLTLCWLLLCIYLCIVSMSCYVFFQFFSNFECDYISFQCHAFDVKCNIKSHDEFPCHYWTK